MSTRPKIHVGIVGAGLGGLAAAIGIARAGHKVTVLEQAAVLGEVSLTTMRIYPVFTDNLADRSRNTNPTEFVSNPQTLEYPGQGRKRFSPTC